MRTAHIVFALHLVIALFYKEGLGMIIQPSSDIDWDYFWQTLPLEALRTNLIESLWYLHAQPPLFNVYGAFFIRLFYPHHLEAMHYANIILGAVLSGMMVPILLNFTGSRRVAAVVAVILALSPTLFLYEAFALYTIPVAFLVVLSVYWLTRFARQPRLGYLIAFVLTLNLMILTRSLYHLVILGIGLPLVCVLAQKMWRRVLVISVLVSLFSVGWYAKNYVEFGFFGASSWQGFGWWRIVSFNYTEAELIDLAQANIIDERAIGIDVLGEPNLYAVPGFEATSNIDVLSRADYNNLNIVAIAKMLQASATRLMAHAPSHYLLNVINAYLAYSKPSSQHVHPTFPNNVAKIPLHESISADLIQGQALAERLTGLGFSPVIFFGYPITVILYLWSLLRRCAFSPRRWTKIMQADAPLLFAAFLAAYTTLVSSLFELGENERFKVLVEQLLWAFMISVLYRASPFSRRRR